MSSHGCRVTSSLASEVRRSVTSAPSDTRAVRLRQARSSGAPWAPALASGLPPMPPRERHEHPLRVAAGEPGMSITKRISGHDPPRFEVRETQLHDPNELRRVGEPVRQVGEAQQVRHPGPRDRRRVRRFRRSPRMCLTGGTLASDQHHVGQAQRPGVEIGIGTYLDRDPAGDLEHGIDEVEVRG